MVRRVAAPQHHNNRLILILPFANCDAFAVRAGKCGCNAPWANRLRSRRASSRPSECGIARRREGFEQLCGQPVRVCERPPPRFDNFVVFKRNV